MNITHNDIKIPLVIGVTGHRDIKEDDIKDIKEKITIIFKNIIKKYPETPLILLSPLADGADRIVAEVALQNNITVSVPLPFDMDMYKETFGSSPKIELSKDKKDSLKEFENILEQVENQSEYFVPNKIFMPFDSKQYKRLENQVKLYKMGNDKKRLKSMRYKQYSLVGEYVAIHSQILIALQNPASEAADGGTAEIVNKKLSGNYEYVTNTKERVSLPERGLVYRILTPRIKDTEDKIIKKDDRFKLEKLFPSDDKNVEYKKRDWDKKEVKFIVKIINIFIAIWNFLTDFSTHLFTKPYITTSEAKLEDMTSFRREHKHINYLNEIINNNYEKIKIKAWVDLVKAGYFLPNTKYSLEKREKELDSINEEEVNQINIQKLKDEDKLRIR